MWIIKIAILAAGVTVTALSAQSHHANAAADAVFSSEASTQTEDAADASSEDTVS